MTKRKWLNERVFVDEYGRPYNLSDIPMAYMTREEAYKKQGGTKKQINELWKKVRGKLKNV